MKMRLKKLGVCLCGFPILKEDIPLGTEYDVKPVGEELTLICGGCGKRQQVAAVWVESRNGGRPGFLPAEIFEEVT